MVPSVGEPCHLLAPGTLGVSGHKLTVNGRRVCLYEYGDGVNRYFSPSLSGASVPDGSRTDAWTQFIHVDDKDWLLELHATSVASGLGYEALFRFAEPGAPAVWVVDRQERIDTSAQLAWRGISLEVTDLLSPLRPDTHRPLPVELAVSCVARRDIVPGRELGSRADARLDLVGLPMSADQIDRLVNALDEHATRTTTLVERASAARTEATLVTWAPLSDAGSSLIALAVADITEHLATTDARRRQLHAVAVAGSGTCFQLAAGGRARVPREWLQQLDPQLASYTDLLDCAHGGQVRNLRATRRAALGSLEGYLVTLMLDVGGRTQRFVEVGLPDVSGMEWDCVLMPANGPSADDRLEELSRLARAVRLDPAGQLLRSLGNEPTMPDLMALLVRVGSHEAHVRRRLSMVRGDGDPGLLAKRYSHSLAGPVVR